MIDLPGIAILEYFQKKTKHKLYVHDLFGPKVEMPLSLYFRSKKEIPTLELQALNHCRGHILDIGAGAGSHALMLQDMGKDVKALEISPASCDVMKERKVQNIVCADFFQYESEKPFDTLLLLMNGIGLCGNLEGLGKFLDKAATLLSPDGQIIFDSSDVSYMYEETSRPDDHYYGEIAFRYEYRKTFTEWFQWLYIDATTLVAIAQSKNWKATIIEKDENDQYLAVLKRK